MMVSGPGERPPARPTEPGRVVGGIVLGLVFAMVAQAVLFSLLPGLRLEQSRQATYVIFLLPGLAGIGLLLSSRTRRIGAGNMLGLSVGTILAAGGCTVIDAVTLGSAS